MLQQRQYLWQRHGVHQHAICHSCDVIQIHARRMGWCQRDIAGHGHHGRVIWIQCCIAECGAVDLDLGMPLALEAFEKFRGRRVSRLRCLWCSRFQDRHC